MTLVILSRRSATSRAHTVGLGVFTGCALAVLLLALSLGVVVGALLRPAVSAPAVHGGALASENGEAQPTAVLERIGALSARMVQLELEASSLTEQLNAVKEFGQRMQMNHSVPQGPIARTPPASAGGPLLEPRRREARVVPDPAPPKEADASPPASADTDAPPAQTKPQEASQPYATTLNGIAHNMEQLAQRLSALDRYAADVSLAHMSFPGRSPVRKSIRISGFGNRIDPFKKHLAFHSGVDFSGPLGTPIHSSAGGTVILSGSLREYGKTVEIDHGAGLVTRYAHLSELLVQKGQVVIPGQLIAKMGSTGRSTGSHLHFEILKDGRFVDPAVYLRHF